MLEHTSYSFSAYGHRDISFAMNYCELMFSEQLLIIYSLFVLNFEQNIFVVNCITKCLINDHFLTNHRSEKNANFNYYGRL